MRAEIPQTISKALKYLFILYVGTSLLYTASHLYGLYRTPASSDNNAALTIKPRSPSHSLTPIDVQPVAWGKQKLVWVNSEGIYETMPEDFLLSKIFAGAMGPSKVIPYYFKAERTPEPEDITITTLVTSNRFPVLSRLVTHYQGPISVAIHVNDDDGRDQIMTDLHQLYKLNPLMRQYVDLHLIVDKFDRQFNMWRNVAKFFARSEYIMMLDVDFHLCTDFRKSINKNPKIMEMMRAGNTALVVPAFEFIKQEDGLDWQTFPTGKKELLDIVKNEKIDMFHRTWVKGHGATNYTKWYQSTELYKVTEYQFSYEPYIIYKKEGSPWCDERFIGYGANKAACLYELYLSGIDYWVLPDDFLIHQTHFYPESARKKERRYNRKLYDNFREEICLRYSRMFVGTGQWNTSRSDNIRAECAKIRGFRQAVKSLE